MSTKNDSFPTFDLKMVATPPVKIPHPTADVEARVVFELKAKEEFSYIEYFVNDEGFVPSEFMTDGEHNIYGAYAYSKRCFSEDTDPSKELIEILNKAIDRFLVSKK